jgi:oligoribonuclease NrnB/cAMP/cGMP phosphodiesterase (DHH superfamily)
VAVDFECIKINKKMLKVAIWTDVDLDGAASYLVLKWLLEKGSYKTTLLTCNSSKLRSEFVKWLEHNKISDFDKVFILDLDASIISDLIDAKNVTIVDHHASHIAKNIKYIHANAHVKECKSTAQLLYETFKSKYDPFITSDQKKLILHVSDYDSYTLALKNSKKLNCLYWTFNGNRVETFASAFKGGFSGFTQMQENAIALYNKKAKEVIDGLQTFCGDINGCKVISTFCKTAHNDVADHLVNNCGAQIAVLVNPDAKTVSFRKAPACTVDLSSIAAKLCDGSGHETAAGGKITDNFLLFTKTLKPCEA